MKSGLYRNRLGSELEVLNPVMAVREFRTLGDIYEAVQPSDLFGPTYYLVTPASMQESGYELVEEADRD